MRPFFLTDTEVLLIRRLRETHPQYQQMITLLIEQLADQSVAPHQPVLQIVQRASAAK